MTQTWDLSTDLLMVGSGGGSMCAALLARRHGLETLILEKTDKVGGSTSMSSGVIWVPNNHLMKAAGVDDSFDRARTYFDATVGDAGPATSPERRDNFLQQGPEVIKFLEEQGVRFSYCDGLSDYYDDRPGGEPRGRSLQCELFNIKELGSWKERLRKSAMVTMPIAIPHTTRLALALRTWQGLRAVGLLLGRTILQLFTGKRWINAGMALQGRMLQAVLKADVDIQTHAKVEELLQEEGRVTGVVALVDGKRLRIQAKRGVLLNCGGFSHNEDMRREHQPSPVTNKWTFSNPGDTGEVIEQAIALGAKTDLLDQSWWVPASVTPDGELSMHVTDLPKPHCIVVDKKGERFVDESVSYMEFGQTLISHGAVPAWAVFDTRFKRRYPWYLTLPGFTPKEWLNSGYLKKAGSLSELAALCGIDANGLETTVHRFNQFARQGRDEDFKRGDRAYDKLYGDPSNKPNASLGTLLKPPFYAVAIYPGDVGTAGGLMTDEHARVLREDGSAIAGLYAAGNCTASIVGRCYPASGASIAAAFVFGYIAARHILQSTN